MKGKALLCSTICGIILSVVVGCSSRQNNTLRDVGQEEQSNATTTQTIEHMDEYQLASSHSKTESNSTGESHHQTATAPIYIGSNGDFKEVSYSFSQEPTPRELIAAIAEETGWNLTLSEVTTTGRGGTLVSFARESVLFTGLPDQQKSEYSIDSAKQLVRTVLDSIERTLQEYMTSSGINDPAALQIYYCMEGNQALVLPEINVTIPMEEPYDTDIWNYIGEQAKG